MAKRPKGWQRYQQIMAHRAVSKHFELPGLASKSALKKLIVAERTGWEKLPAWDCIDRYSEALRNNRFPVDLRSDDFLKSFAWRKVRMQALKLADGRCACCGASRKDGVRLHVDHIKPRKLYPELALELSNLQVLCEVCNHGKGNWDETDWR